MRKQSVNLIRLTKILNDGAFHDGESIGNALQVTRSAVWKAIRKLQAYGIQIESVKGKGYALLEPLLMLEKNKIKQYLPNTKIDLTVLESIDSTNAFLRKQTGDDIKICVAEEQTYGKGRFNRDWHSPFAANLYLSCSYPFKKDVSELAGLSLVVSLALSKALQKMGLTEKLKVKWPNDILVENKKIAGSLIEVGAESHGHCRAIIGVGVNVNMLADDNKITQPWTSLRKNLQKYIDRNQLCAHIIEHLLMYIERFEAQGFAAFAADWMEMDFLASQKIFFTYCNEKYKGKMAGVNDQGHLLLQLANGNIQSFSSGIASLIKR